MELYFAPLEGITKHLFRNTFHEHYPGIDKYFIPFIEPHTGCIFNAKEKKDVCRENNSRIHAVPQIMTRDADGFLRLAEALCHEGYQEINLNLGCPSATVVNKGRGSGFLKDTQALDCFLSAIYRSAPCAISIKTRTGRYDASEFPRLLELYNQYPVSELIIHPRTREDFYNNSPDLDAFATAVQLSKIPLCYNGDITDVPSFQKIQSMFPQISRFMLGRGLIANPQLAQQIRSGNAFDVQRFLSFHDGILQTYRENLSGDEHTLMKMKELWNYWIRSFPGHEKEMKRIRKTHSMTEYELLVHQICRSCI